MIHNLSIVIPCYNYARFLPRLFASLAGQGGVLPDAEIIVVDDGSRDGSADVARELCAGLDLPAWKVLDAPHSGLPGRTRNLGLAEASGDYLLCLDPDDEIAPGYLAAVLDALKAGADVAYTDYLRVNPDGVREVVALPEFEPDLLRAQNILAPTAAIKRRAFEATRGYRENTAYEDWDLWVQLALAGARFRRIPEALYVYHLHEANFSHAARRRDGEAKAWVVRNNKRFFPRETGRWADALLRGEIWAQPFGRGLIPRAEDVAQLKAIYERVKNG